MLVHEHVRNFMTSRIAASVFVKTPITHTHTLATTTPLIPTSHPFYTNKTEVAEGLEKKERPSYFLGSAIPHV